MLIFTIYIIIHFIIFYINYFYINYLPILKKYTKFAPIFQYIIIILCQQI